RRRPPASRPRRRSPSLRAVASACATPACVHTDAASKVTVSRRFSGVRTLPRIVAAGLLPVLVARAEPVPSHPPPRHVPPAPPPTVATAADVRDAIGRAIEFTVTIESDGIYGAGIVIAPAAGLVLTAHHVVESMHTPLVTFRDGRRLPGHLVESD